MFARLSRGQIELKIAAYVRFAPGRLVDSEDAVTQGASDRSSYGSLVLDELRSTDELWQSSGADGETPRNAICVLTYYLLRAR